MTGNPYTSRMGLADPSLFCGRRAEMDQALGLLQAPSPSCVSLVGPPRIGKTTLLERLVARVSEGGRAPGVSLPPLHVRDEAHMFRRLAQAIAPGRPDGPPAAASSPEGFVEW